MNLQTVSAEAKERANESNAQTANRIRKAAMKMAAISRDTPTSDKTRAEITDLCAAALAFADILERPQDFKH